MNKKLGVGIVVIAAIVAVAMLLGCIEKEEAPVSTPIPTPVVTPSPTPTPTPLSEPKFARGDFIREIGGDYEGGFLVIGYDKVNDTYRVKAVMFINDICCDIKDGKEEYEVNRAKGADDLFFKDKHIDPTTIVNLYEVICLEIWSVKVEASPMSFSSNYSLWIHGTVGNNCSETVSNVTVYSTSHTSTKHDVGDIPPGEDKRFVLFGNAKISELWDKEVWVAAESAEGKISNKYGVRPSHAS